ncbi:two-component system histidine kinase PnpS [Allobacillus sp. GCM10007491]|uniref:histidine kinase n=1 Tax=Allobacillus saliphilus TaxID=2912308 RepID=A0A941CW49_9BACI|nr:HAMP domain-containing sensor histidine kinase [Allobacillus saliphilus]MBR7554256.1 PAS domain-containing protein [Allobacillus saliphilus]
MTKSRKAGNRNTLYIYILLIIAFFAVLGYVFSQIAQHYVVQSTEQQLNNDANFIGEQLEDEADRRSLNSEDLNYYAEYFQVDLYYQDHQQELSTFVPNNDDFLEILRGQASEAGYLLENDRLIYRYAVSDNTTLVVVSEELPIRELQWTVWLLVSILAALVIAFLWSFGNRLYDSYVMPIRKAADTAERLVEGDYQVRIHDAPYGIASELSHSINRLARNLEYITGKYENQNDRLNTVVNNMVSGVLLVNDKGITRLINDAFIEYFSVQEKKIIGEVYYEVIDHEQLNELIQEAIFTEEKKHALIKTQGHYFDVHVAPIKNADDTWKGIVVVCHDITQIKQVENVRKDFVANVSHELRTPLTSIQGFAETLLEQKVDEQKANEFLKIIEKESKRLNNLVEDLLDLALLEKDSFQLEKTEFRLKMLMDEVHQVVEEKIVEKNIKTEVHVPEDLTVFADYHRWYQLVLNLYVNAVQYTDEGGSIEWTIDQTDEEIILRIKDNGIGIPKEKLHRIFERFYRVDQARSRQSGGTGLGLSIVKHIVEVHEGEIEIDSSFGEGTEITVHLPKNK